MEPIVFVIPWAVVVAVFLFALAVAVFFLVFAFRVRVRRRQEAVLKTLIAELERTQPTPQIPSMPKEAQHVTKGAQSVSEHTERVSEDAQSATEDMSAEPEIPQEVSVCYCVRCGAEMRPEYRFCAECGTVAGGQK